MTNNVVYIRKWILFLAKRTRN